MDSPCTNHSHGHDTIGNRDRFIHGLRNDAFYADELMLDSFLTLLTNDNEVFVFINFGPNRLSEYEPSVP